MGELGSETVDKEWILLMITAKHLGLTAEEIREFLNSDESNIQH
ncbi:anti-repressor SinI family protein [Aquibacillus koreensis]|uniref:Anti-repressor SinI family protein n=1 Tax=Aquibacillus koreensis TaxID=279446 RepID=A0A9X3WKH1_9BACI|nr:anti-repressor SinI family protein [Aquibacillus koreensis]MCT2534460.1 anti-repressor SinI family protein [Aquibacillus koreensis]MDC3421767.1 anti-repressor SinI family protein [Aquibacillus koreensis]